MWRRAVPRLQTLAAVPASSLKQPVIAARSGAPSAFALFHSRPSILFAEHADAGKSVKPKAVEDVMPIATGFEREEIEYELQGKKRFDLDAPTGPFGTKEAPAIVESYFDKRIVGCPGGAGDEEHDVIWFWLEKDKPFMCPICDQYFELKVIGPGGPPGGHHH